MLTSVISRVDGDCRFVACAGCAYREARNLEMGDGLDLRVNPNGVEVPIRRKSPDRAAARLTFHSLVGPWTRVSQELHGEWEGL